MAASEGDLLNPASLASAVEGACAVIHLAAVFRTPDTGLVWKSNLAGTRNLIAAAKARAPRARFIMASTGLIYDRDTPRPGREDDACTPKLDHMDGAPARRLGFQPVVRTLYQAAQENPM